jgi:hypothetical protein
VDTWCDIAFVRQVTGVDVTDADLGQAQPVIDLYSNVTVAASGDVKSGDLYRLRLALAYQCAWQSQQIDTHSRIDVSYLEQDAVRVSFLSDGGDGSRNDALILAPLAKRAIERLSWKRSRSVRVDPPGVHSRNPTRRAAGLWLREAEDGDHIWSGLDGAC